MNLSSYLQIQGLNSWVLANLLYQWSNLIFIVSFNLFEYDSNIYINHWLRVCHVPTICCNGQQQKTLFWNYLQHCRVEGETIREEWTQNTHGTRNKHRRTSAQSANCKSGKASWRWQSLSCVPNNEEHLDKGGIWTRETQGAEVESEGRGRSAG